MLFLKHHCQKQWTKIESIIIRAIFVSIFTCIKLYFASKFLKVYQLLNIPEWNLLMWSLINFGPIGKYGGNENNTDLEQHPFWKGDIMNYSNWFSK